MEKYGVNTSRFCDLGDFFHKIDFSRSIVKNKLWIAYG